MELRRYKLKTKQKGRKAHKKIRRVEDNIR